MHRNIKTGCLPCCRPNQDAEPATAHQSSRSAGNDTGSLCICPHMCRFLLQLASQLAAHPSGFCCSLHTITGMEMSAQHCNLVSVEVDITPDYTHDCNALMFSMARASHDDKHHIHVTGGSALPPAGPISPSASDMTPPDSLTASPALSPEPQDRCLKVLHTVSAA